jgi:tetratricopeptide (TPR) repeat protein
MNASDEASCYRDFLEKLNATDSKTEKEWLTLEFSLENLPGNVRELVWAAAVPHWFDRNFLAALLNETPRKAQFDALLDLSFVEPYPGRGHAVHERSRKLLLDKLWQSRPSQYRKLSARAAAYCAKQDRNDTAWRVEWIYHLLIAKPEVGADKLFNTSCEWQNPPKFAYDKVEVLVRAAREHLDAGRLVERGASWTLFWEARLDQTYSRFPAAKEKLQKIPLTLNSDPYTAANCLRDLGDVHLHLSEMSEARVRYEQALPIYQTIGEKIGEANCLRSLGDMHLCLSEMNEARTRYEQALPIYQTIGGRMGEANCLHSLGNVYLHLSEMSEARARYEQALPIYQAIGARLGEANCLHSLGDVHLRLSEADEARMRYEQALPVFQAIGARSSEANCLNSFGDYHREQGEYGAARKQYAAAMALFREIGGREGEAECLEGFAKLHEALGDMVGAAERWREAAALYEALDMPKRAAPCREAAERLRGAGSA